MRKKENSKIQLKNAPYINFVAHIDICIYLS